MESRRAAGVKSPQNAFKRFSTPSPATIAIVVSLAAVLLVVVVLFSLDRKSAEAQRSCVIESLARQAYVVRERIGDRFRTILSAQRFLVEDVIRDRVAAGTHPEAVNDVLLATVRSNSDVIGCLFLDAKDGRAKAFASRPGAADAEKAAETAARGFLATRFSPGQVFPVTGQIDPASARRYVTILDPLVLDGKIAGVLAVAADLESVIDSCVIPLRPESEDRVTLIDDAGMVLYDRGASPSGRMLLRAAESRRPEIGALYSRLRGERSGTDVIPLREDGKATNRLVAWNSVRLADRTLFLFLSATDSQVNEALLELRNGRTLLGILSCLFLCVLAVLFFRVRSLRDLRERKGELEQIATDQDTLLEIFKFFGECVTVNDLYLVLNGSLASILKFRNFVIGLRTSRRGDDTVVIDSLGDIEASRQGSFLSTGQGIIGHVMRTGRAYNAGDLSRDPHYVPHNKDARSLLAVPVIYKQFQWGVIGIEGHVLNAFGERETRILGIVASYIALHMEEMEARRELDIRAGQFRFLNEFVHNMARERNNEALCSQVTGVLARELGFPWVGFYSASPEDGRLRLELAESHASNEEGAAGITDCRELAERAAAVRAPRRESYSSGIVYMMAIPLQFGDSIFGILCAVNARGFSETEVDLFEMTAAHMSTFQALNNLIEKRRQEAMIDLLTGVWNRRYIMSRLEEETGRPMTPERPGCVAIADMGNFKGINDRYGHLMGDEVLRKTAASLRDNLRDGDMIGRYGGDEFLFYLSGTGRGEATETMARLADVVASIRIPGVVLPIILDWGMAFCPGDADNLLDAVKIADERMYERKSERKRRQGA